MVSKIQTKNTGKGKNIKITEVKQVKGEGSWVILLLHLTTRDPDPHILNIWWQKKAILYALKLLEAQMVKPFF